MIHIIIGLFICFMGIIYSINGIKQYSREIFNKVGYSDEKGGFLWRIEKLEEIHGKELKKP